MRIDEMAAFIDSLSAIDRRDFAQVLASYDEAIPICRTDCEDCDEGVAVLCESCADSYIDEAIEEVKAAADSARPATRAQKQPRRA